MKDNQLKEDSCRFRDQKDKNNKNKKEDKDKDNRMLIEEENKRKQRKILYAKLCEDLIIDSKYLLL